jgi:hypothetical protein
VELMSAPPSWRGHLGASLTALLRAHFAHILSRGDLEELDELLTGIGKNLAAAVDLTLRQRELLAPTDPARLTPASVADWHHRFDVLSRAVHQAKSELATAWHQRNEARYGADYKLDQPRIDEDPAVQAAAAAIADARTKWIAARAAVWRFLLIEDLRCGIEIHAYEHCTLPAGHTGAHLTTEG